MALFSRYHGSLRVMFWLATAVVAGASSHELHASRGQCLSSNIASSDGTADLCETTDEVQMLQKGTALPRLEAGSEKARASDRKLSSSTRGRITGARGGSALALNGGGFTAFAFELGVIVGLLASAGNKDGGASPTLERTGLLDNVEIISSVSGGSWFASSLLYSKRFLDLVHKMAADPSHAASIFNDEWFLPYRESLHRTDSVIHQMHEFAEGTGIAAMRQVANTAGMVAQAMDIDGSWASAVRMLLETTADLPVNLTLGSGEANSWAQGKVWLAGASLAVPNSQLNPLWAFVSRPTGADRYAYWAKFKGVGTSCPVLPARFSWRIGETASTSSFPFVASSALPPKTTVQWIANKNGRSKWSSTTGPVGDFAALRSGALPVHAVAASSSAVLAGTVMGHLNTMFRAKNPAGFMRLATYFAVDPGTDDAYTAADRIFDTVFDSGATDEGTTKSLGRAAVVATFDGAYTDNTGIGNAVAAGASSVTALVNDIAPVFELFQEERIKTGNLFGPLQRASFGIFTFPKAELRRTTAFDHVQVLVSRLDHLDVANATLLESIQVGQIQVVTQANEWFGIEAGREVNLTLVFASVALPGLAGQGAPLLTKEHINVEFEILQDVAGAMSDPRHAKSMGMLLQSLQR